MQTLIRTNNCATRAGTLRRLDHGALDAMEPPAAKKLAAGARKPASLAAGASKPAAASLAASAHKPKAKPQKVRGDLAVVVAARAVQQHLEKFQRPFTAAQLWENTQKVVAKKEIVAACARLAQEGDIAVKEFQGGKVLLYYAEPDAMARRHGAFATPEALCDVCFDVLPCVEINILRRVHAIDATPARWRGWLDGASAATSSRRND